MESAESTTWQYPMPDTLTLMFWMEKAAAWRPKSNLAACGWPVARDKALTPPLVMAERVAHAACEAPAVLPTTLMHDSLAACANHFL